MGETRQQRQSTNQTGPSRSGSSCSRTFVLFLVLLSFLLLIGLIGVSVHYHYSVQRLAAELSTAEANMIKGLQAREDKISSLTEERDLLNVNITKMTKELIRLQDLTKQMKTCPTGWTTSSCTCYLLSTQRASWENARRDCRDRGADLVIVNDYEEQALLSDLQTISWIGLTDVNKKGNWTWIDGSPLTLRYWAPGQPNNFDGEEDCAHFRDGTATENWNDLSCNIPLQWICEKKVQKDL